MNRTRTVIHLTLVLAVAISAVAFFIPTDAKASCWYPKRITVEYWGYYWGPGDYRCYWPVIGPVPPMQVIGERITECDGTVYTWGVTNCDTTQRYMEQCEPICD